MRQDVVAQRGERRSGRLGQLAIGAERSLAVDVRRSIDLRVFTEPQQGATYDDLLAVARRAEQLGFGAFFRSDHYLAMGRRWRPAGCPGRPTPG